MRVKWVYSQRLQQSDHLTISSVFCLSCFSRNAASTNYSWMPTGKFNQMSHLVIKPLLLTACAIFKPNFPLKSHISCAYFNFIEEIYHIQWDKIIYREMNDKILPNYLDKQRFLPICFIVHSGNTSLSFSKTTQSDHIFFILPDFM